MHVDERNFDALTAEVFNDEVTADYSLIFDKPAEKLSASAQTVEWRKLVEQLDTSQHAISNLVIDLPQPKTGSPPKTVKAVGQYAVTMTRKAGDENRDARSVGRYELEVVRTEKAGNPWRVSFIKPIPVWSAGSKNLFEDLPHKA